MKSSRIGYLSVLLLAGLCSCGVLFDTPMPASAPSLSEFPAGMVGRYHLIDSTFIDRKDTLYNAAYYEQTLPSKDSILLFSVDLTVEKKFSYFTLKGFGFSKSCAEATDSRGKRHEAFKNKDTKIYQRDGYTVHEILRIDTILNLKKKDRLKHDGKAYYLNHFLSQDKAWEIFRLKVTGKDALTVGITDARDKKNLERFIVKKRLMSTTVHLSDEQFSWFIKQGGFDFKLRFRKYGS